MSERSATWQVGVRSLVLLATVFLAGALWRVEPRLQAQIRPTAPPVHFQSGGARSEAVLQQIAASLERIENRLQRLEELAGRLAGPASQSHGEERRP